MINPDLLPLAEPMSEDKQISDKDYLYLMQQFDGSEFQSGNEGYYLPGDTVALMRSSGTIDEGWAFAGTSAEDIGLGVFVKMIGTHRASKNYPYHWDRVS